ncbi:MinD/ParA family protein [Halobacteriales archaeon Cl-PHB]
MGGSVFAFAGGKGGVGKTTTTANVAVALARQGYEVVAVDADIGMTNLGEFVGVSEERGVHHVLAGEGGVEDVLVGGPAGVRVVPGGDDVAAAAAARPENLREVVEPLRHAADVVLLDTGAGISHQNMVAYGLADAVALVTTADDLAANDAAKSGEIAGFVDSPVIGTVATRVRPDADLDRLEAGFDGHVVAAVPEYEATEAPEPRVVEAPGTPGAAEYHRLAETLAACHERDDYEQVASEASAAVSAPEAPTAADAGPEGSVEAGPDGDGLLAHFPFLG